MWQIYIALISSAYHFELEQCGDIVYVALKPVVPDEYFCRLADTDIVKKIIKDQNIDLGYNHLIDTADQFASNLIKDMYLYSKTRNGRFYNRQIEELKTVGEYIKKTNVEEMRKYNIPSCLTTYKKILKITESTADQLERNVDIVGYADKAIKFKTEPGKINICFLEVFRVTNNRSKYFLFQFKDYIYDKKSAKQLYANWDAIDNNIQLPDVYNNTSYGTISINRVIVKALPGQTYEIPNTRCTKVIFQGNIEPNENIENLHQTEHEVFQTLMLITINPANIEEKVILLKKLHKQMGTLKHQDDNDVIVECLQNAVKEISEQLNIRKIAAWDFINRNFSKYEMLRYFCIYKHSIGNYYFWAIVYNTMDADENDGNAYYDPIQNTQLINFIKLWDGMGERMKKEEIIMKGFEAVAKDIKKIKYTNIKSVYTEKLKEIELEDSMIVMTEEGEKWGAYLIAGVWMVFVVVFTIVILVYNMYAKNRTKIDNNQI
ncbi:hypothetical protein ECANGB1_895 [Enterospora canceri]|uniref:Uncharacterized protein n=1 Tax=Enterospora canceri TaxID=1081671 RepID=A0A1Y1S781_9MICR|nr:hypothetical protein ECANGB1_895 [Enterospora canceri]